MTAVVAAIAALSASAADAATVTVGNPVAAPPSLGYTSNGAVRTVANLALADPAAHITSPVSGTMVQWRMAATGPGQFSIRVLRPSGANYLGAGTSTQIVPSAGSYTFAANLPIQAGDLVGLDVPNSGSNGIASRPVSGSTFADWAVVADGSLTGFTEVIHDQELLFNADVQYGATTPTKKCKKKHNRSAAAAKKTCKKKKKK